MSKKRKNPTTPVYINCADARQLQKLSGIGPVLASSIFGERTRNGEFEDLTDLMNRVAGLGPNVVEKMADAIRFDVPTTALAVSAPSSTTLVKVQNTIPAPIPNLDASPVAVRPGWTWTEGQLQAIRAIRYHLQNKPGEIFVLRGYAGTGKTSLLVEALRPFNPPVMLAPTNKAAAILYPKALQLGGEANTVHRWLGYEHMIDDKTGHEIFVRVPKDIEREHPTDVPLVIDEVSMIGSDLWAELCDEVRKNQLMCIAMGDPLQLPPVGERISPAFQVDSGLELTEVMRSQGILTHVVLKVRERIHQTAPPTIRAAKEEGGSSVEIINCKQTLIRKYFEDLCSGRDAILLAWTNKIVKWANTWIRNRIVGQDSRPFVPGEVLVVMKPYRVQKQRLYTESRLRIIAAEPCIHPRWGDPCWELTAQPLGYEASAHRVSVEEQDEDELINTREQLKPIYILSEEQRNRARERQTQMANELAAANDRKDAERCRCLAQQLGSYRGAYLRARPGYATTVHKSQGSTWSDVYVLQSDICRNDKVFERNRLLYVAYSRAARRLIVYG